MVPKSGPFAEARGINSGPYGRHPEGTIGLRFPSRRRCGCEAWRRMAGNLAAISAIRAVEIRTAEIAIRPAARILARSGLRNDNYANHGGYQ